MQYCEKLDLAYVSLANATLASRFDRGAYSRDNEASLSEMPMTSKLPRRLATASIALAVFVSGCNESTTAPTEETRASAPMDTLRPAHRFVSFYRLLARPEVFDRSRIHVQGILAVSSAENFARLYVSSDAFRNRVVMDSISLRFTDTQWQRFATLNGRFIAIEGEFQRITSVDDLVEVGVLEPVSRLIDLSSEYESDKSSSQ